MSVTVQVTPHERDETRQQLIYVLRSGKYRQGRGFLHQVEPSGEHLFCCLGVACELVKDRLNLYVSPPKEQDTHGNKQDNTKYNKYVTYNMNRGCLPSEVVDLYGFNDFDGGSVDPNVYKPLYYLNDTLGQSFSQIADALESGAYWDPCR